jgi:signal recognition particle subunit SRP54
VERAAENFEQAEAEKLAKKVMAGKFDLEDMLTQLRQVRKMGDIKGLMGMIPGIAKMKKQIEAANIDDSLLVRQEAIILSMTQAERTKPNLIKASRKKRIAAGSGTSVQEVNKLLKQYDQMAGMMKKMKKMGKKGALPPELMGGMPEGGLPGGLPGGLSGGLPGGLGGGLPGGLPPGLNLPKGFKLK